MTLAKNNPRRQLGDYAVDETALISCWGSFREIAILGHDDCGLTTCQNLRTLASWTMPTGAGARCPEAERRWREQIMASGDSFHSGLLGPEEWYGWDAKLRIKLCRIHRYRKVGGIFKGHKEAKDLKRRG